MAESLAQQRGALIEAAQALFRSGVMQHSGHGNLSAKVGDEEMLLTATGNIRDLTADNLAVVSFAGEIRDGRIEPTAAEIVAMHAGVYRARPGVGAVIHTHSPYLTAFALANAPLPCAYEALLRFGVADAIPVAAWAPRGSAASVANIVEQLERHPFAPAVLLGNHGVLAFARDPVQTARLVLALEEAAEATLRARRLGGERPFPAGALEQERAHMSQFGSGR
jgi:L-ribulose-5-phosphate 4-epimerase